MNFFNRLFRKVVWRYTPYDADEKISQFVIDTILEYMKAEKGSHPKEYLKEEWERREKVILVGFYSYLLNCGKKGIDDRNKHVTEFLPEIVHDEDHFAYSKEVLEDPKLHYKTRLIRERYWKQGMKYFYSDFMLYWI